MTSQFSNFFKKLFWFVIFLFISYLVFIIIWGLSLKPIDSGHLQRRLSDLEKEKKIEILVLGSSRAYRHYDPRIFSDQGFNIFVLGSSAQTVLQSEFLLNQYLSEIEPDIIIYDIYPNMFISDGLESTLDIISHSKRNVQLKTYDLALIHKNVKVFNYYLYGVIEEIIFSEPNSYYRPEDNYVPNGYVEKSVLRANKLELNKQISIKIREEQKSSFDRIIKIMKDSDAEILMVQSPMQLDRYESYEEIDKISKLVKSRGLNFLDFNDINILNDNTHFYDPLHLNQTGVEIYNNLLIKNVLINESLK